MHVLVTRLFDDKFAGLKNILFFIWWVFDERHGKGWKYALKMGLETSKIKFIF